MPRCRVFYPSLLGLLAVAACTSQGTPDTDAAWAVNLGGPALRTLDGTYFAADPMDDSVIDGRSATMTQVLGTQNVGLYTSYRAGLQRIRQPLANGRYSVTFHFAEPTNPSRTPRRFDIRVEDALRMANLDVRAWRDGRYRSALAHTVIDVDVTDGVLDIVFDAIAGEPLLNALLVRLQNASPGPAGWTLIWSDEFTQDGAVDAQKWTLEDWPAGRVNREAQVYTRRAKNARVEAGRLIIEAHKERFRNGAYTSARLHSAGKGDFRYGRAEVRARLPGGRGAWAAIWMLPTDHYRYATTCARGEPVHGNGACDAWPNSGELDIMEYVGHDPNRIHATVHTRDYFWVNAEQRRASIQGIDVEQAFHTYAIEWSPERIVAYFDGVPYFHYANDGAGWRSWPFDHPFHIVLNLAIGGNWGAAGGPIDDTIFPVRMEVDYVRVYERRVQEE